MKLRKLLWLLNGGDRVIVRDVDRPDKMLVCASAGAVNIDDLQKYGSLTIDNISSQVKQDGWVYTTIFVKRRRKNHEG